MKLRLALARASLALCAIAAIAIPGAAPAQSPYPGKPIRFIVPFAAGGTADLVARVVTDRLQQNLGQPIVIENRPGGGGAVGAEQLAKAEPDGYTLGLGSVSSHATNAILQSKLRYDPRKDFTPIGLMAGVPNVMVVSAALPVNSVAEFIAYAKERPGKLNFGSIGNGTSQHLGGELFNQRAGVKMLHIPYSNNAMLVSDLANGKIHVIFDNLPNVLGQIEAGKFRALGVTTDRRWPKLPNLPTLIEEGVDGYNISSWVAMFGPANLPPAVLQKLSAELTTVLAMPEVQEKLVSAGTLPMSGTPEDLRKHVDSEIKRWTDVIAAAEAAKH